MAEPRESLPTMVFFSDTEMDEEETGVPQGCQVAYVKLLPSDIVKVAQAVRVFPAHEVAARHDAVELLRWLENEVAAGDEMLGEHVDRARRVCDALGCDV